MLNIFNKEYYLDLDNAIKSCQLDVIYDDVKNNDGTDVETDDETDVDIDDDYEDEIRINVFKFDIIKMCIDRVLNNYDENDDISSMYSENKSFKIAIATLIKNKILIELEDEDEFE
jgi:uncharacterized protein (DUF342 family)